MIYRNKKLLALAKHSPKCFCCGATNDGTVVAAHANLQIMGKGMGIKAADIPAFVCATCHDAIDGRSKAVDFDPEKEWYRAAVLSMRWVLENHPDVI